MVGGHSESEVLALIINTSFAFWLDNEMLTTMQEILHKGFLVMIQIYLQEIT